MVNGKGRDITDKDMIAAASVVDVPARTVKAILEQVGEAVAALPAILAEVSGSTEPRLPHSRTSASPPIRFKRPMPRPRAASRIPPRFHAPGNAP